MNKKILLTTLAVITVSFYGVTYAENDTNNSALKETVQVSEKENANKPGNGFFKGPRSKDEFGARKHGNMRKFHPSKAEMEKKKAEFEKRLKLTDEQKKKIEENRKHDHDKVKIIFEQKHEKIKAIKEIYKNDSLTKEQKQEKAAALKDEIKKLDEQANSYREENMKAFEAILTDKQKKEFAKIKEEQKKEMEKRRAEFQKKMEQAKKNGKRPDGFRPAPKEE